MNFSKRIHPLAIAWLFSFSLTTLAHQAKAAEATPTPTPEAATSEAAAPQPQTQQEDIAGKMLFGFQIGQHYFNDQEFNLAQLKDRPTLGLRLGYAFTNHFDIEGAFTFVPSRAAALDVNLFTYGLSLVGNLLHGYGWTPYASLGVTAYSLQEGAFGQVQDEFGGTYAAGLKWFFTDWTALRAEFRGIYLFSEEENNFEATLGLVAYADMFRNRDRDRDGIADKFDKCPRQAEDRDNHKDEDGCPDLDNDGDGILDNKDLCPNDAEDKDGYQDEDGCPEADNDSDGILDADDRCPLVAEDKDNFQDEDGCPEGDNDGDGVSDDQDKCPNDVEDKDGYQDEDGCPEADNDSDGITDAADKCPNEPETVNGVLDEDGCPDEKLKKFSGVVRGINFALGSNIIELTAYPLLDEAAEAFKEAGNVSIIIEGHTDNVGGKQSNLKLSKLRAESVRQYLVAKGISPFRLRIVGYGYERPIASNATSTGRALNRRIEFKLESATGKEEKPEVPKTKPE